MKDRPLTILLVEDNQTDILLTERAMKEGEVSCDLHVVRNGEEALAYLRHEGKFRSAPRPNLVLLDINLPRVTGLEVLEDMRHDPALRRVPVVMLSVSDDPDDIRASYDRGANSYVTKPGAFKEYIQVVRNLDTYWRTVTLPNNHAHV